MRKLSLLLVLLLLSVLPAAASAQAATPPQGASQATPFAFVDDEELEAEADAGEESEGEGEEVGCTIEDEEDVQLCAEIAREEREEAKADGCVLEDARAAVTVNPGKRRLRLTVRYRTSAPGAEVVVEATLQGPQGAVRLGASHARFHRFGVYRDSFELAGKQTKKASVAGDFLVELRVAGEPATCALELTGDAKRAKR
jgi:hypothetical protein